MEKQRGGNEQLCLTNWDTGLVWCQSFLLQVSLLSTNGEPTESQNWKIYGASENRSMSQGVFFIVGIDPKVCGTSVHALKVQFKQDFV